MLEHVHLTGAIHPSFIKFKKNKQIKEEETKEHQAYTKVKSEDYNSKI